MSDSTYDRPPAEKVRRKKLHARPDPVMEPGKTYVLPDFLIIGGMKCGTSSLGHKLHLHPQIFLANKGNEVHYFDRQPNLDKGLDWYRAHFPQTEGIKCYGDKTPAYIDLANPPRIKAALPDVKLLLILRDPVSRFQSQYNYTQRPKVREAMRLAHQRPFHISHLQDPAFDQRILTRGFFAEQLESLYNYFPKNQVHVALLDDFKADEQEAYNRVYDFLGVDRVTVSTERFNEQEAYPFPLDDQAKRDLYAVYAPHNARLFQLLGKEIPAWSKYASL